MPRQSQDREAVRTLVAAVGPREAARQLNISPGTVTSWSTRGKWGQAKAKAVQAQANTQPQSNAVKPSTAMANCLDRKKLKTKWNLACYTENASKVAAKSRAPLAIAQDVRHVAAVMSHIWPEQHQPGLSLQILNVNGGML